MVFNSKFSSTTRLSLGLLALGMVSGSSLAQSLDAHVAPAITRFGRSLGQESPSTQLTLTVWLNMHNKAELDAKVKEMYTTGSPSFHKWMTLEDVKAYAPTAKEVAAVKAELGAHNLKVISSDALGLSVRFTGATTDVERAFHTQINRVNVKGQAVRTSSSVPVLSGEAAGLVSHLAGLNSVPKKPMISMPIDRRTRKPLLAKIPASAHPDGVFFTQQCFYAPISFTLAGLSGDDFTTPETAFYTGLGYGAPNDAANADQPACGYSASDVRQIYGLDKAYAKGFDGTGQSIAIIDVGLVSTIQADVDTYDTAMGLPPLNSSNFQVISAPFGTTIDGIANGYAIETDLDVELAHATAPGAKINLLLGFSFDDEDLQNEILYAITNKLGNVISVSIGGPESETSPLADNIFDEINELGAAQGVSVNYATGDSGDFTADGIPADVSSPADSPYSTAVGGTSVAITAGGEIVTTGWGTNINYLSYYDGTDFIVENPVESYYDGGGQLGFAGGSGGGISAFFAKPFYQAALPGPGRHLPDVSALADPNTGAEFVYSDGVNEYYSVVGGTSLATPIFSGIWAMADQAVGGTLGLAAPYIAVAPAPIIEDVLPITGPANATGSISTSTTTTSYSATDLAQPLGSTTAFISTIFNYGPGNYTLVTFGTDSSLTVTEGWDNVTGWGTPNVGAAIDAISAAAKEQK